MNNKLKIFFLEDNINRYAPFFEWLEQKAIDPHVLSAKSYREAIEIFKDNKEFDVIFLDHDLGGKVFIDSRKENTGYTVAKYILNNNIKYEQCIIHSQNPAGANNIQSILKDAIKLPFPILIKS
jgi:CheY-like chemotaxis protein